MPLPSEARAPSDQVGMGVDDRVSGARRPRGGAPATITSGRSVGVAAAGPLLPVLPGARHGPGRRRCTTPAGARWSAWCVTIPARPSSRSRCSTTPARTRPPTGPGLGDVVGLHDALAGFGIEILPEPFDLDYAELPDEPDQSQPLTVTVTVTVTVRTRTPASRFTPAAWQPRRGLRAHGSRRGSVCTAWRPPRWPWQRSAGRRRVGAGCGRPT